MKNKLNLFRQYAGGLVKFLFTITFLLTLCVGQMWADPYNFNWHGNVFFRAPDNWDLSTNSTVQVGLARTTSTSTSTYCFYFGTMTRVGSTRLYYCWISANHSSWNQNEYIFFTANPSAKSAGDRKVNSHACHTAPYNYGVANDNCPYLFNPTSESNGASVSGTCYTSGSSYSDRWYPLLDKAQTVNLYTNGSSSNTGGSVTIAGTYMSAANTTTTTGSATSSTTSVNYTTLIGSSVSLTATPATGYQFDGWYTAGTGGSLVSSSNPYSYTCTGTKTVYARFSYRSYSIAYKDKGGSDYSGSNGASLPSSYTYGTGIATLTAGVKSGYVFDGWYDNESCTGDPVTSISSSATGDKTFYAKFTRIGITLTAETGGKVSTNNSDWYDEVEITGISFGTAYNIYAKANTGYSFTGWTKGTNSANTTITTASTPNTISVSSGAVTTVTAGFSEVMSTLSTSNSYDAGNPSYSAPSVSGSATTVGYATTRTITATAAGTGYTFAGWTLTNCTRTDGGGATANPITVRSNGDGAAATVVANYEEVLTSRWHLVGANVASKVTFPDGWNVTNTSMMQKASGHSTESVVYGEATVSNASGTYEFKVVDDNGASSDIWYGYSTGGTYLTWTGTATKTVYSGDGNANNLKFTPTVAGTYTFKVDYSGTYPTVTITYPVSYTLTYSVGSVSGNNGSISTSPSTSSGSKVISGSSVTLTAPAAKTGYTWKGWYTNPAGTTGKIDDTDRAITVTMNADKTLYACYTENTFNVKASASPAAGGSVTPTSNTSMGQITGGDITASPNAGYSFSGWSIASGTGYFGTSGTATTSNTANTKFRPTAAATLTGSFSEVMRTVGVTVNNSYLGSVDAASLTSVGPVTKSAEVTATAETGASFTRWDVESGITIASGYSNTDNPVKINATAASKTLTAVFTETKYTVTMNTADEDKGTVDASSASVGQITAVRISATAKSGYMFSKWVKTSGSGTVTYLTGAGNGQVEDASGEEKEETYICVTGNVTLQATWEADRSSGCVVHYGNSGKNADGGTDASQTRPWKDGKLYRATTEASDVSYFTFTAGVGDVDKVIYFKIHDLEEDKWYGYNSASGGKFSSDITNVTLSTDYGDARMCIIMPGSYKFTWNKSTKKLSVAYPDDVYYLRGGWDSWSWSHPMTETSSGVYSATVNMTEANHTYEAGSGNGFKVLIAGKYYGKDGTTVTRSTSTGSAAISSCSTSGANIGITTDYTGDYTFTYTVSTNTLQVTYPTAYKITFGKGSVDGTTGSFSAVNLSNGNSSVTSNSTWVKSGHDVKITAPDAKSGYRYLGWYDNNSATGDAITTNANCTISVTAATTVYACYAENMSTITVSAGTGGTVTTGSGEHSLGVTTTQAINATASTGYSWSTWTITGNAVLASSATTASNTAKADGTNGGSGTITATFTPNHYDVILDVNGATSGSNQTVDATFAAAMPTVQKGGSTPISAPSRTGYNFDGYWSTTTGTGTQYYTSALASNHVWDVATNETHIYAKWNAKQSAITFDYQTDVTGYSSSGDITNTTGLKGTYDADMTALTGTMPSAANGYAFMGFYDATGGGGTKYYNADGSSAHTWDKNTESGTTLYAYYKKAEITAITFSPAAVVAPNATITATPTISPTPTGTTSICWRVLYSNDNPLDPQPTMTPGEGNSISFSAKETSGTYKVEAILHLGGECEGATLDSVVANFLVAGDHEVTVQYKDASGNTLQASGTVTGKPLEWSAEAITAPDIFGYTFARWEAGDGVTISTDATNPIDGTSTTTEDIYIKAIYDGRLTAVYNQNQIIYFKNTLGWENVFVNFHAGDAWNNTNNPQGSPKGVGNSGLSEKNRNNHMIQIGESDIYYYDYGAESISPSLYISFTNKSRDGVAEFWGDNPDGIAVVYPANYADAISTNRSSENGFKAATPMFVPLAPQTPVAKNVTSTGKANYYNSGYWTTYTAGTGYTLEIYYDNDESACIYSIPFTSADDLMPMKAKVDLEASTTYRYQVRRGGTESAGIYYGNTGTMTYDNRGDGTGWIMENTMEGGFKKAKITTNASGDYTFNLTYSANASSEYRLRMKVDYPIADKDYRLVYSDATQTKPIISAIVTKANNSKDTVSFFIRPASAALVIQQATVTKEGAITWNAYSTITSSVSGLAKDSVYNICLTMDGTGAISVENVEAYTGNFYIRTNAAGSSKWDNFRSSDHLMTYSEYSAKNSDYSHYFMAYVGNTTNIKFVVANDYAPNISDTVIVQTYRGGDASHVDEDGNIKADANVRFMWNRHNNGAYRAYLAAAKSDESKFLVLRANSSTDMMDENGNALIYSANSGEAGYNHKAPDNSIQFVDDDNWIYEATVKVKPSAFVKLYAYFNSAYFYYKGENNDDFDAENAIQLMTGTGAAEKIHVIYDFKTDRLVAAWMPSGNISEEREINADVMFVREHQGDIEQLTFSKGAGDKMGAITDIKTAYAVLRFNKWTLNNKSKAVGHAVLNPGASRYERDLFYVSFPFRVSMEEVFGFGKYGQHWIVEEYDGEARAANGFWADTPSYWRFITNRKGKFFEPNKGYIIALDLDELGESSDVWNNGVENVELYFPSYGTMGDITNATVVHTLPAHAYDPAAHPTHTDDRSIKDSHWNVMSVPTYVNTSDVTFANTTWTASKPSFLYEWNMDDNSLTARSGSGYTYHAMHAYIVQYAGNVTWTSTSVTPASIVARRTYAEAPSEVEFRLELQQNEKTADHTFVRLSNDEEVSAGFAFGEDMSKEFNKTRSNIYTFIGTEQVAGNILPMTEQTTVVPVGVIAKTTGDYTFAIPEGTNGVGVTLIDIETGIRTSLSALDYTVNLGAGTYNERFVLEISPVQQTPTGIGIVESQKSKDESRKILIDGLLYIVKDGKMFDATGALVK